MKQVKKSLTELSLSITPMKTEELAKVTGGLIIERNRKREKSHKQVQRPARESATK